MKLKETNRTYAYKQPQTINNLFLYYDAMKIETDKYAEEIIDPGIAWSFQGNLYGLLDHLQVDPILHLPTLYLNGYTSPFDFDGRTTTIKIAHVVNFPGM